MHKYLDKLEINLKICSGRDSDVLHGLNVEESSGSSQVVQKPLQLDLTDSQLTDTSLTFETSLTDHEQNENQRNSDSSEDHVSTNSSSSGSLGKQNLKMDSNFNDITLSADNVEVIEIPFETPATKSVLQIELLRNQIEYTKRDIYHRELLIFEKETSLLISNEDRNRLLENSEAVFSKRRTI